MKKCPYFECLASAAGVCAQHPGCEGCGYADNCNICSRQSALVTGIIIPCDMISLPIPCRFCEKRNSDDFSSEVCLACPKREEKREKIE